MSAAAPRSVARRERVRVIIVNYKSAAFTMQSLHSLRPVVESSGEVGVVVVDNDSGDGDALEWGIAAEGWSSWATLIRAERNGGFSYGNNLAIRPALASPNRPGFFLLLNPDTEVRPGAIEHLVAFLDSHPDVGIAGSSFENSDGSDWPIAFRFPTVLSQFEQTARIGVVSRLLQRHVVARVMSKQPAQVDWVAGASMMIRAEVFESIGLLDEDYFLYFEEVDFCLRASRAGWSCWYVPASRVLHHCGQSTGVYAENGSYDHMPEYWHASRRRYFRKNHGALYGVCAQLAFRAGKLLGSVAPRW